MIGIAAGNREGVGCEDVGRRVFSLHWESVKGLYPFPGFFSLDIFSRHGTTFLCTARLSRRQKTIMIKKQLNLTHVC